MEQKIIAVVVTYNRLQYLPLVITALKNQTSSVHKIIVVNNGSTDNTKQWLESQNSIDIIHQANVGGSGGFCTGVKAAFDEDADWVWMMDDDVWPDPDCLEVLMRFSTYSSCLNPLRIDVEGSVSDEERWFDISSCNIINLYNQSYKTGKKIWYRNLGSFEGMIVSRDIIEKIGFPDPRFFIAHDDLIYGYLANKHTNVAVVADAVMRKQPVSKTQDSAYNYAYYYIHRNLWILEEYAEKELKKFSSYRKRRIKLHFLYTIYKIFFVDKPANKLKALRTLAVAYTDYKQKKAGIK